MLHAFNDVFQRQIRTTFILDVFPDTTTTADLSTPNSSAKNRTSSAFAAPSSGTAARSILNVPFESGFLKHVFVACGRTLTENVIVPLAARTLRKSENMQPS